ncbi:transcriptional regulator, partial [Mycobacterium kansasii]
PAVAGPPLNMLRATLHPDGLEGSLIAPHHWRANALRRARRQLDRTADQELADLIAELETYPIPEGTTPVPPPPAEDIVVPLRVATEAGVLS